MSEGIREVQEQNLILNRTNGSVLSPVEVSGEIASRELRRLLRVGRQLQPLLMQPQVVLLELLRGEVGELGDAVDGGGIDQLVALGAAQVSLEDGESVIVLLLGGVRLAVLGLEQGEVVVGVQELVDGLRTFGDDLADQRIVGDGVHEGIDGSERGGEEGESNDERESQRRHYRSGEEEKSEEILWWWMEEFYL